MTNIRAYPRRGRWVEQAACRCVDTNIFYDRRPNFAATARAICAECPVQFECLDYAIACESLDPYGAHGIWAGLDRRQRNALRKQLTNTQPNPTLESA